MCHCFKYIFGIVSILMSCHTSPNKDKVAGRPPMDIAQQEEDHAFIWQAKRVSKTEVGGLLKKLCDSLSFEVTDLYSDTDSIPDTDWLILDDSLKTKGFKVMSTGQGNWEKGPRMISMEMQSPTCSCRIDKLYYVDSSDTHRYRVTERIACL